MKKRVLYLFALFAISGSGTSTRPPRDQVAHFASEPYIIKSDSQKILEDLAGVSTPFPNLDRQENRDYQQVRMRLDASLDQMISSYSVADMAAYRADPAHFDPPNGCAFTKKNTTAEKMTKPIDPNYLKLISYSMLRTLCQPVPTGKPDADEGLALLHRKDSGRHDKKGNSVDLMVAKEQNHPTGMSIVAAAFANTFSLGVQESNMNPLAGAHSAGSIYSLEAGMFQLSADGVLAGGVIGERFTNSYYQRIRAALKQPPLDAKKALANVCGTNLMASPNYWNKENDSVVSADPILKAWNDDIRKQRSSEIKHDVYFPQKELLPTLAGDVNGERYDDLALKQLSEKLGACASDFDAVDTQKKKEDILALQHSVGQGWDALKATAQNYFGETTAARFVSTKDQRKKSKAATPPAPPPNDRWAIGAAKLESSAGKNISNCVRAMHHFCPSYSVEASALLSRTNYKHNGPYARGEIRPGCVDYFKNLEQKFLLSIQRNPAYCEALK